MNASVFCCEQAEVRLTSASGEKTILQGIDLNIGRGEFLCMVGGSGTGKTTLLRALGGFCAPTGGAVFYEGAAFSGPPAGVVTVFQDYGNALLPWRTVRGNVALGIEEQVSGAALDDRIDAALAMVGLQQAAREYPAKLSGGMQQRLQIARALALQPKVLLMDEPFGALDAMTKAKLQDQLRHIQASTGTTIVFITHDVDEAVYLGDRVILLAGSPGRITSELRPALPATRDQISTKEMPEYLHARHELLERLHGAAR
ncbi:ABC transporter ATP-binding protein [Cupriavidus sp. RAF20_2]|jgi:NitT/TauT family transport system ATP-binding protein|uniref:ABC transporter ATP-binding protein n=2 Tax=unclassified Cupriavidus TaxID=2640874 RepID=UPI003F928B49